jgi:hypothetical protein
VVQSSSGAPVRVGGHPVGNADVTRHADAQTWAPIIELLTALGEGTGGGTDATARARFRPFAIPTGDRPPVGT